MKYLSKYLSLIFALFFIVSCQSELDQELGSNVSASKSAKSFQFAEIIETLDKQNYEEALSLAKQLPESAFKYNFLGVCHRGLDDPRQAIDNFQKAIAAEGEKNLGNILINLGHALGDLGNTPEAEEKYRLVFAELDQTDTHKRGIIHLYLGDINTAIHFFEAALEGRGNSQLASSYNYLAYAHYLKNDLNTAKSFLDLATQIDHNNTKVLIQTKTFTKIINSNSKNGNDPTGGVQEDFYP